MNNELTAQTKQEVQQLVERWIAAELRGDVAALGDTLADDVRLVVGPRGFVLAKAELLQRFAPNGLKYSALNLVATLVRRFGDAVVVIGTLTQQAKYQGDPADGQFRVTLVLVSDQGRWQTVSLHYSPLAGPV